MDKSDSFPEILADSSDSDDVEILEVVGVEPEEVSPPASPQPLEAEVADDEEEEDAGEYLLDFDDPDGGMLDGEARAAAAGTEAESDGDTDHQRLMRVRADYDNLRKRIDREREEFELYANFAMVSRLLPVVDNLERALAADSAAAEGTLREGLVMIHRQLTDQLQQEGLRPIEAVGQPFDPNLHDAVATEPGGDEPPNTVLEEFQKGYLFQDRVVRPAMVKVSTGPAEPVEDA